MHESGFREMHENKKSHNFLKAARKQVIRIITPDVTDLACKPEGAECFSEAVRLRRNVHEHQAEDTHTKKNIILFLFIHKFD